MRVKEKGRILSSRFKNVFVKPNEQSQVYLDYAMARKGRMNFNVFVKPNEQNETRFGYAMARKGRKKFNII
ncbi:MAG: hypothetical protein NC414_05825 [Bacteroidales bacterium]|nr:hypothetical protein [Bacteroidales bacterium]